jgi:hypothetical protein
MAKAVFTFDEMVYNSVVSGKQIYYDGETKTIDYVKLFKDTRQVEVHATDGDIFLANQDDEFEFEVTTPKPKGQPTKPKLRGKQ